MFAFKTLFRREFEAALAGAIVEEVAVVAVVVVACSVFDDNDDKEEEEEGWVVAAVVVVIPAKDVPETALRDLEVNGDVDVIAALVVLDVAGDLSLFLLFLLPLVVFAESLRSRVCCCKSSLANLEA
jgi:hypothetical protein